DTELFTTLPDMGWYYSACSNDASGTFSSGGVAKFAGVTDTDSWGYPLYGAEAFNLGYDAAGDFRLEFSARNIGWDGINIALWNDTHFTAHNSDYYARYANFNFYSGGASLDYTYLEELIGGNNYTKYAYTSNWMPDIFNGNWARYAIEVRGRNVTMEYSIDGTTFLPISFQVWDSTSSSYVDAAGITDLVDRSASSDTFQLHMRVQNKVEIDNVVFQPLDGSGNPTSTTTESFDADIVITNDTGASDGIGLDDIVGTYW
ncbi:MAG: hypothetical protein HUJ29_13505, partial [Gammaproteobacteria bacterium]|nr:hypothetical protein [Gammaproteobacteria bacterium]